VDHRERIIPGLLEPAKTAELNIRFLRKAVTLALEEDFIENDVTTAALAGFDGPARARVLAREAGIISGIQPFRETCRQVDPELQVELRLSDRAPCRMGEVILRVCGRKSSVLKAERTALNFLGRLSGVATATSLYLEKVKPLGVILLDTRKTTPGLRYLEKEAVLHGGGANHRLHLAEMALIKDNHISMAGSLGLAVELVRRANPGLPVEVEVQNIKQLTEALSLGVEMVMLDNFSAAMVDQALSLKTAEVKYELSGNVTLNNISQRIQPGIDFVSVGALTHGCRSIDFTLEFEDE